MAVAAQNNLSPVYLRAAAYVSASVTDPPHIFLDPLHMHLALYCPSSLIVDPVLSSQLGQQEVCPVLL